ncbi:MAG: hypothetical protein BWK73_12950 [Thiothrix lacustris]|uniref:DUF11 domain-containing protein n=1 Tax=Thiothrix lacustris TaxID=525917 RepID=A0A1Y1QTK5_9GAMM|nr:MAG: hypothetical protein BWK73_12950 [Thiothrix lacustris]
MEVTSADLKITDMQCNGVRAGNEITVTTTLTIHNDHDDAARHIQVIVVLPPTSHVVSTTPGAVVGPSYPPTPGSPWSTNGYVIFLHPDKMDVKATFKMTLVTKMLDTYVKNPIAAFVFGSLPDPNPSNNYHEAAIIIT